ncbi:NB-ARC domain-containing protein [Mycobacterium sp. 2YAF39]|uniref:ATP-binding protein n=1 Tax=Mycobacterium sp. 2YAF39 TaxID=3233033 RepID=UPI003F94315E
MTNAAPSGVVTFLFTDIEGSTRRWEADADAMRSALGIHDAVLRDAIQDHGGVVFKHTGDGVCAVFASPGDAVDAAVAAQRSLELPVRMGLATGEAQLRDGDYFGAVLNRAARVMAAGHGGQILLDGTTAGLVPAADMTTLGSKRLRDIAKPVEIFQVQAAELRTDFPPLKTEDSAPGNLRVPTTNLIGRETELNELQSALKQHRLVTLTGVGGVGKTRLALEIAGRSASAYLDGVFVIELAAIADETAIPEATAAVLGVKQQPGMTVTASIASALRGRSRLLVFDNCEHVLDSSAGLIGAILGASSTVTILATSREGLGLADEQLWPVPSLDVGSGVESTAAMLFVERVQAVSPAFSASNHPEEITEICQRLDGIPLAIELAASRMQSMTVTEVRDRLDRRFRLLVGSRRQLERHQTLRHAVQWSYDLLDDNEKDLLATCSVFSGGFDLAAACGVSGSDDEFTTLDTLDALVRKSLVVADRSAGHTRYSMLETIRQFAEEQLVTTGDPDAVRTIHARYFAGLESSITTLWDGPRQREAYSWLTVEMANLRTAFRFALDSDDIDSASAIAIYAALAGFWSDHYEPIRWNEELIEPARRIGHRRLAQLYGIAALCFTAGRIEDALGYATAGQEAILSGRFDETRREHEASLAAPYAAAGEPERWLDWCRTAVTLHPDIHIHTRALFVIALQMAGQNDEAIDVADELPAMLEATDNPTYAAWALFAYGTAYRDRDSRIAYDALRRGLEIAQASGSRQTESNIAAMLTSLTAAHGEPADALDYSIVSIRNQYDSGNFFLVGNSFAALASLFVRIGRAEAAATLIGCADTPFNRSSFPMLATDEVRLRDALGDDAYDSLARAGAQMTLASAVTYACEQIDRVRAEMAAER